MLLSRHRRKSDIGSTTAWPGAHRPPFGCKIAGIELRVRSCQREIAGEFGPFAPVKHSKSPRIGWTCGRITGEDKNGNEGLAAKAPLDRRSHARVPLAATRGSAQHETICRLPANSGHIIDVLRYDIRPVITAKFRSAPFLRRYVVVSIERSFGVCLLSNRWKPIDFLWRAISIFRFLELRNHVLGLWCIIYLHTVYIVSFRLARAATKTPWRMR